MILMMRFVLEKTLKSPTKALFLVLGSGSVLNIEAGNQQGLYPRIATR